MNVAMKTHHEQQQGTSVELKKINFFLDSIPKSCTFAVFY